MRGSIIHTKGYLYQRKYTPYDQRTFVSGCIQHANCEPLSEEVYYMQTVYGYVRKYTTRKQFTIIRGNKLLPKFFVSFILIAQHEQRARIDALVLLE